MYKNILAAIDLTDDLAAQVIARATEFLGPDGTLNVLHAVEPQYVQYSFDPTLKGTLTESLEQGAVDAASRRLEQLCEPYGIDREHRWVVLGRAADVIHDLADRQGCDLIVVGSHGQEGLRRLLGSTANAVLHGAPVDVATVRISDESKS